MAQRICDVDGCERKHVARGYCGSHYNRLVLGQSRYKFEVVECATCGADVIKRVEPSRVKRYCSDKCKGVGYQRDKRKSMGELVHVSSPYPVTWLPPQHPVIKGVGKQASYSFVSGPCAWCGTNFTDWQPNARFCSPGCGKKAGKAKRRAREAGASGTYTWAEVARKWIDNGKVCHYCHAYVPLSAIEPDHVVPLSRGGSNSIVNVVPCCRSCNCDKRDLMLADWPADRARRGLPPLAGLVAA